MKNLYAVIGLGLSGAAAASLLTEKKEQVLLYDDNTELDKEGFYEKYPELKELPMYLGELPEDIKAKVTTAVLAPGVPLSQPIVQDLKDRGAKITGEVELAFTYEKGRVCAITGTNGKTTTTSLLGELLRRHFDDVHVVGNIGIPYTKEVLHTTEDSVIAAEISSFQLETISSFAPMVSAILNITPDHLNRHGTMEAYIQAKEAITKNQTSEDVCVLNYEDEVLRDFGKTLSCRVIWLSGQRELKEGYYYRDGVIYRAPKTKIIETGDLQILGLHNYENAMAAIAMSEAMGVPLDEIRQGLMDFRAVEHRIEFVCEKRGVRFYDDSKGTNPDAAIKGICAMDRKTCLIGGGYDKDSSYDEWIRAFDGKVKKLVLIGQTREKIADCAKANGFLDYCFADSLEEAIDICYATASEGEAVLLSPACASWGMFKNYEERGDIFKAYARGLKE